MRTEPQQARSAARVERILDATAELIGEVGLKGLTTQLVAERSGMSIGSVYRYFPDRTELLRALGQRNLERFASRLLATLAEGGGVRDWWHLTETAIDVFVALHHDEPGFRELRLGDVVDERLLAEGSTNNAVLGDGLMVLAQELLGIEPSDELRFATRIGTEIVDRLLKLAFAEDPAGDARVIAECKRVTHGYLAAYLEDDPSGP